MASIRKINKPTEHQIQSAFFDWVNWAAQSDERFHLIYAIPNGGHRHKKIAGKLKDEGVRSGVWDVSVDIPTNKYPGLKIEFKAQGNTLTLNQHFYGQLYKKQGYKTIVCYTADEAVQAVLEYLR